MKNKIAALLVGLTTAMAFAPSANADLKNPKAVIELFTSQGCSSCPPADRLLKQYIKSGQVLALSWHVDYWDYLGWKDTFASAGNSNRQRRYAKSMRERGVYTPQVVVNGRDHAVGSRKDDIDRLIRSFSSGSKGLTVPIKTIRNGNSLKVSVAAKDGQSEGATMWMVFITKTGTVKIKRGENRGRSINYHNIVRDVQMLGMVKNGKYEVELDFASFNHRNFDGCAIILQRNTRSGTPGPIIGATLIEGL